MVLRRPGTIHRKIAMNSNIEKRKSKKFKMRMQAKRERAGIKKKTVRVDPNDAVLLSEKAVKDKTRVNPLGLVKMSKKKANKLIKKAKYRMLDKKEAGDAPDVDEAMSSWQAAKKEAELARIQREKDKEDPKKKNQPLAKIPSDTAIRNKHIREYVAKQKAGVEMSPEQKAAVKVSEIRKAKERKSAARLGAGQTYEARKSTRRKKAGRKSSESMDCE